ncbi:hypothetical protein [Sphingomonas bacterium]|uniref:hypothetical protein n=1 Tax=Sphingomonas bacterium TaxID=1895847 RepID=UPI0015777413|nr:hypothetical protein [Sphingomonas bacterium]
MELIKDLVEGRLKLPAFREALDRDGNLRVLLGQDVQLPPYTRHGTLLDYVLAQDGASAGAAVNVVDAMEKFLTLNGVDHRTDEAAREEYRFILSVCPA